MHAVVVDLGVVAREELELWVETEGQVAVVDRPVAAAEVVWVAEVE